MRHTPDIGSLDDFYDDDEDGQPRIRASARGSQGTAEKSVAGADPRRDAPERASRAVSRHSPEDTISLDGMTIDEILALSDSPPADADELSGTRDDTGEWDAIEDMLDPDVMLQQKDDKK